MDRYGVGLYPEFFMVKQGVYGHLDLDVPGNGICLAGLVIDQIDFAILFVNGIDDPHETDFFRIQPHFGVRLIKTLGCGSKVSFRPVDQHLDAFIIKTFDFIVGEVEIFDLSFSLVPSLVETADYCRSRSLDILGSDGETVDKFGQGLMYGRSTNQVNVRLFFKFSDIFEIVFSRTAKVGVDRAWGKVFLCYLRSPPVLGPHVEYL